jgi:hypothetical protein
VKSSGFSFLNSSHSVTSIAQSAFFRHFVDEDAYFIFSLKTFLMFGIAIGSYVIIFAPSLRSWFIIFVDRASLMSSLSGLKLKPRMAIVLPFSVFSSFLTFCITDFIWSWLALHVACIRVGL